MKREVIYRWSFSRKITDVYSFVRERCRVIFNNVVAFTELFFSMILRRNSNANLDALSTVLSRVGLTLTALFPRGFRHKKI